jgi:hypothetical protein
MFGKELKAWRERMRLRQERVAEKLGVTRTTIQNWESGATPIPKAVEMSCEVWEHRLKQEDPDFGPVTLIYSNGPMFINPQGPRSPLSIMRQEPYLTNAAAIARVQKLWGRDDFHNPFVIEGNGKPLWNVVELERVINGSDTGAPTLANLIKAIAKNVRATSTLFPRSGPKSDPSEMEQRQHAIEGLAEELENSAVTEVPSADYQRKIEDLFSKLRTLGKRPPGSLVNNVAQAFVAAEINS